MIDDDGAAEEPFARAYDFFKHMTGIALISIGGIFAFMDSEGLQLERRQVVITLAAIGLSGVMSLIMSSTLASLEVKPIPREKLARQVQFGLFATAFLIAVGLGGFVMTFGSAMLR